MVQCSYLLLGIGVDLQAPPPHVFARALFFSIEVHGAQGRVRGDNLQIGYRLNSAEPGLGRSNALLVPRSRISRAGTVAGIQ